LFKRRLVLLGVLSFAFVWLYSMFSLLFVLVAAHAAAAYWTRRRVETAPFLAVASGVVAGLVINPYFPQNLNLLVKHIEMKARGTFQVDVGIEWYAYDSWILIGGSAVAFAIYFAGLVGFDLRAARIEKPLFLLLVSVVLLVLTFKYRRFVEYWPPVAVLFAAFSLRAARTGGEGSKRNRDQWIAAVAASLAGALIAAGIMINILGAARAVRNEDSPYRFRGASNWLRANTPRDAMVFNTDWDDFPILFYENRHNRYIVGLDPTYLYERDHDLWDIYARITLGEEKEAAPVILDRFGAEYVVTDNDHIAFLSAAAESRRFTTVYSDEYSTVLRITKPVIPDSVNQSPR
jgi:hypothetical protein